jgi:F0F1-type ATP synthase assembly protein I
MLAPEMEPAARPSFQPAAAGGVLLGMLLAAIAVGALLGWAAGSVGIGALIGAVLGIPLAVYSVYRRYRRSF